MSITRTEGSLLKKKQEQWAREKVEDEGEWFPFGRPGGGSPNRKFETKPPAQSSPLTAREGQQAREPICPEGSYVSRCRDVFEGRGASATSDSRVSNERANVNNCTERISTGSREEACTSAMIDRSCEASYFEHDESRESETQRTAAESQAATISSSMSDNVDNRDITSMYNPMYAYSLQQNYTGSGVSGPLPMMPLPLVAGPNGVGPGPYYQNYPFCYPLPHGTVPLPVSVLADSLNKNEPICPVTVLQHMTQFQPTGPSINFNPYPPFLTANGAIPNNSVPLIPIDPVSSCPVPVTSMSQSLTNETCVPKDENGGSGKEERHVLERILCESDEFPLPSAISERSYEIERRASVNSSYEEEWERTEQIKREALEIQERAEAERIAREREQLLLREKAEEEARLKREAEQKEIEERRRKATEEAWEKAQREAEIARKARFFKHVIDGNDRRPELEEQLLGVDSGTANKVLDQLSRFERQRSLEKRDIDEHASKVRLKSAENSMNESISSRSRSSSSATEPQSRILPLPRRQPTTSPSASSISTQKTSSFVRNGHGRSSMRNTSTIRSKPAPLQTRSASNENIPIDSSPKGCDDQMRFSAGSASRIPVLSPRNSVNTTQRPQPAPRTRTIAPADRFSNSCSISVSETDYVDPRSPERMEYQQTHMRVNRPYQANRQEELCKISDDMNPLFSPISTRSKRMRPSTDSHSPIQPAGSLDSTTDTSSGSESRPSPNSSPVPEIKVDSLCEDKPISMPKSEPVTPFAIRNRNNNYVLGFGRHTPGGSAIYCGKINEKGCTQHIEDVLSPDIRRKAESNLSRQSSVNSLRGSVCNLRGSFSNLSMTSEEQASSPFRSLNPAYRSFNIKKTSERNERTLATLKQLRERLRARENFAEKNNQTVQRTAH